MAIILPSIACNLDRHLLSACYPLLAEGRVSGMEWSFDALFDRNQLPPWFEDLLHAYSKANALVGHGIFFSLFSGRWLAEHAEWLGLLRRTRRQFPLDHVTEHFGFMTGADFHTGAPLPVPYNASTLRIGQDRLKRIQDAAECPVGLENLAFSYCTDEVKRHGDFLRELVQPVNGFVILDLHNVYCQLHNFSLDARALLQLYPLELVREIHLSGGSWQNSSIDPEQQIRRDTHDEGVPEKVFELLEYVIDLCPHCKYVVLEQIGTSLESSESQQHFYVDYLHMQQIIEKKNINRAAETMHPFFPTSAVVQNDPIEDEVLFAQQRELAVILENSSSYENAVNTLSRSTLANTTWNVEQWQPEMIDTAMQIAKKWKNGMPAPHPQGV